MGSWTITLQADSTIFAFNPDFPFLVIYNQTKTPPEGGVCLYL
jgi:hypothetical protein